MIESFIVCDRCYRNICLYEPDRVKEATDDHELFVVDGKHFCYPCDEKIREMKK